MKKLFLLLSIISFGNLLTAAQAPPEKIIAGLDKWYDENPQEKVFVQTDRDKYVAGETVWFKAWCTLNGRPSFLSRILYVVLSDNDGVVVDKKMFLLDSSATANGVIDLPKSVVSGNYLLTAYTLWMLNYPQFVFEKSVFIYGSDYLNSKKTKPPPPSQLHFFPEGGELVEGLKSRIAFKAINSFGLPAIVQGSIYTKAGQKITDFSSLHDGMGFFELQPMANMSYIAKLVFEDGLKAEYNLPVAKNEGVSLLVNNSSPSRLFILVERSEAGKQKFNKLYIVAQMDGIPVYKATLNFDAGESAASIAKKTLPAGIIQITIFDSTGAPLAERLAFIENYKVFEPKLSLQKLNTGKRTQNLFSFQVDSTAVPFLSALVIDESTDDNRYQRETIISSLLLSADIKGPVNNAGYYFLNKEKTTLQHLDLLLMTQGWRRFTWKQIKGEEPVVLKYPIETYMNIKGKATLSDRPDQPLKEGMINLIIKGEDSTSILSNAYLTDKGEFIIDSIQFRQKAIVSYQGINSKKTQLPVDVKIYPAYIDSLKRTTYRSSLNLDTLPLSKNTHLKRELDKFDPKGTGVMETITVTAKKISRVDSLQRTYVSPIFENSDQTLMLPENRTYQNIWQFLNATVPGFSVNPFQPGGVTNVSFSRHEGMSLSDEDSDNRYIKFMLNEIQVPTEVIDGLNPSDIALVKIYKGATAFVFGAEAGAISIYTKKGVGTRAVYDKNFSSFEKTGFAYSREFYNPNYSLFPDLNKTEADYRPVLYWNPKIKQDKNQNYSIEFHNNDITKSYKLIIQGLDSEGRLIYKEQIVR